MMKNKRRNPPGEFRALEAHNAGRPCCNSQDVTAFNDAKIKRSGGDEGVD